MKQTLIYITATTLIIAACLNKSITKTLHNKTAMENNNFTSGYSNVNGIKMYYEIHGQGEPLVLIHGGGSTISTSFGQILPLLADSFQVIAVEVQGHGHTSDRDAPKSFEQDADDVATLLSNLKISKASFFGFSNGGNTSIQIANRHPEIVNKLILASTFYKREAFPPGFFEMMKQATITDMPQPLRDAFLKINPDSNKLLTMFNKDRQRMVEFEDWSDETLSNIKSPTLIICGDQDGISVTHTLAMSKLISCSRLMVLPAMHGGYMGVAESPSAGEKMIALTASVIKDFLYKINK